MGKKPDKRSFIIPILNLYETVHGVVDNPMSLDRLAKQIGISRSTLHNWTKSGNVEKSDHLIPQIASILRVDPELLRKISRNYIDITQHQPALDEPHSITMLRALRSVAVTFKHEVTRIMRSAALDRSKRESAENWARRRKKDDPATALDVEANKLIIEQLETLNNEFELGIDLIVSEECNPYPLPPEIQIAGANKPLKTICLIDPLDGSKFAARGLGGAMHLASYSPQDGSIQAALVLDIKNEPHLYYSAADFGVAFCETSDGKQYPLYFGHTTASNKSEELHFGHYHSSTFRKEKQPIVFKPLLEELKDRKAMFYEQGGSLGLCYVAAGQLDGYFEIAKGFKPHDAWAGLFILEKAGGKIWILNPAQANPSEGMTGLRYPLLRHDDKSVYSGSELDIEAITSVFLGEMEENPNRWKFLAACDEKIMELLKSSFQPGIE